LTRQEIEPVIGTALEMRKRVTDQLAIMLPAEFGSVDYRFEIIRR
jgi:predicted ATP-dependent Lon-type protease